MTPNFWWLFERHIATDSSRDPLTRACVTDWTSGGLWACASVAGNAICALGRHWQAWFLDLGVTRVRVAQLTRLFVRSSTENVHLWNKILYFIFFAVVKSNLHSYNVEFVSSEAWISLKTKKTFIGIWQPYAGLNNDIIHTTFTNRASFFQLQMQQ